MSGSRDVVCRKTFFSRMRWFGVKHAVVSLLFKNSYKDRLYVYDCLRHSRNMANPGFVLAFVENVLQDLSPFGENVLLSKYLTLHATGAWYMRRDAKLFCFCPMTKF